MSSSSSSSSSPSLTDSSSLINYLFLDARYSLMTGKMVHVLYAFFKLLDVHGCDSLNDLQFYHLMRRLTSLSRKQIYMVFDMLDTDGSGTIDFDEFYLLFCILVAQKDLAIKKFIHRHSRTVFDLLDTDGSNEVSVAEFAVCGFLFNFHNRAIQKIFGEFDLSGDEELDYREFRLFTMACIDKQQEIETARRSRFRSQQIKDSGVDSMDVEHKKSKLEASRSAGAKTNASSPENVDPKAEADQRNSKKEADLRNSEAKELLEKTKRDLESEKTKEKPDKSRKDLESGKGKESPDKSRKDLESGKAKESSDTSKRDSESGKGKESPDKSRKDLESGKAKESSDKSKRDSESGKGKESPDKSRKDSESGKGKESPGKSKIESESEKSKTEAQSRISEPLAPPRESMKRGGY